MQNSLTLEKNNNAFLDFSLTVATLQLLTQPTHLGPVVQRRIKLTQLAKQVRFLSYIFDFDFSQTESLGILLLKLF